MTDFYKQIPTWNKGITWPWYFTKGMFKRRLKRHLKECERFLNTVDEAKYNEKQIIAFARVSNRREYVKRKLDELEK